MEADNVVLEIPNSPIKQDEIVQMEEFYSTDTAVAQETAELQSTNQTILDNSNELDNQQNTDSMVYEANKGESAASCVEANIGEKADQLNNSNPENSPESYIHELRFMIFTQNAGGLIGKGAEKIKMFREKFNVNVNVPMTHSSLRIAVISGKKTPLLNAFKEILPCMRKAPFDMFQDKELQINLLVPEPFAPIIIGTGGTRISSLRKETNCGIKIFDENLPYCTERMIVLAGSLNNIIQVIQTLLAHFENNNFPKKTRRFDCTRLEYEELLHMMRLRGGASRYENDHRYHHPPPTYTSPRYDYHLPPQMPPPMPPIYDDGPVKTIQVSVNSKDAGTIIGPNGLKIREIRDRTACKIEMDEALPGCGVRVITLTGTDRAINNAQFYMQKCIRDNDKNKRKRKGKVGKIQ